MRSPSTRAITLAAGLATLAACSTKSTPPPVAQMAAPVATPVTSGTIAAEVVRAEATVEKIDYKTRHVTLKRADGSKTSFRVDDRVKRLSEIKKGDVVVAEYYQSLAYQLLQPGEAAVGTAVAGGVERAQQGDQPGIAGAAVATITAKITKIDRANSLVTLEGPEGEPQEVKVRDPKRLEAAKVGDLVELTYTEAVAISVEKPGKK
jgi:Cu/Ag efflux protein CusF